MGAIKHQMFVAEEGLLELGVDARVAHCVVWSYDPLTDKPIGARRRLSCLETAMMQVQELTLKRFRQGERSLRRARYLKSPDLGPRGPYATKDDHSIAFDRQISVKAVREERWADDMLGLGTSVPRKGS